MLAGNLITDDIPSLKTSDTGTRALHWMEEFKVSHLPIVEGREYIGLISDTDILDNNISEEPLSKYRLSLMRPFVLAHQHVFEAIKLIANIKLSVVPVVDEKHNYLGLISINQIMQHISSLAAVQEPGGIIVLELNSNDYSLSQIAQIVEGNDAKVLSCFVASLPESTKIEVTLKINREDLSAILQTFHRYNYTVKASFHRKEFDDDIKNRFDAFMNYLNI